MGEDQPATSPDDSDEQVQEQATHAIADALQKLSLEERERALYDVHGVTESVEETPAFISEKMKELQEHLQRLATSDEPQNRALKIALSRPCLRWSGHDIAEQRNAARQPCAPVGRSH